MVIKQVNDDCQHCLSYRPRPLQLSRDILVTSPVWRLHVCIDAVLVEPKQGIAVSPTAVVVLGDIGRFR